MRRPAKTLTAVALALALVVGVGACGDDDDSDQTADEFAGDTTSSSVAGDEETTETTGEEEEPAFTEDEADAVLEYSLIEYEFNGPVDATAGKLFFKATNDGTEDHELEILDDTGEALGEIVAMPPEAEGSFAVELAAGTYTFQCILENANGESHKDLGMVSEFTVK